MALVQCPKCGETISNTAKKCIHCGIEFSVCSECGNLILSGEEFCGKCGAVKECDKVDSCEVVAEQAVVKVEEEQDIETETKINQIIDNRKSRERLFKKICGWLHFLSIVVMVCFLIIYFKYDKKTNWLPGCLFVVLILALLQEIIETYQEISADKEQKKDLQRIDKEKYSWYIKKNFQMDKTAQGYGDFKNLVRAAYLLENPQEKKRFLPQKISFFIGSSFFPIVRVVLLFILMKTDYSSIKSMENSKQLLIAVLKIVAIVWIPMIAASILEMKFRSKTEKVVDEWAEKFKDEKQV